jgi:FtsP/CotA-like multicopper oxidase with cupredoxin domain
VRRLRNLLFLAVALVVLIGCGLAAGFVWAYRDARVDTVGEVAFDRPLAIPDLADSRLDEQGRRVFDLILQRGAADLGRSRRTPTWGINGDHLGPTLRARRGEEVLVNVTNKIGEPSTLHWHGMHLPAEMDGGPHQLVDDGETWAPTWKIDQPAATLWYHPHPHGETAEHVYRGLAGMFLVDDGHDAGLPSAYGVDDIPVIVQDKKFDGWELDESEGLFRSTGILGDTVLVNGTPGPYLDVTTELVRLRVLNASNARIFRFHLSDDRAFDLVGTDGGLLPGPVPMSELELSPGERAEIVVRMAPRETVVLRSKPLGSVDSRFAGTDDALDVMELRAGDRLEPAPDLPDELAPAPDLADDTVAAHRRFELTGTRINGKDMDLDRIDLAAEVDTTEAWTVVNVDGSPHNFHVHDVQFQVTAVDGDDPAPYLGGWKDTVFVPPDAELRLRVRFTDYSDPDSPYMFHCHLLRHEDSGMMGQFVVVGPGEAAGRPDGEGHHH